LPGGQSLYDSELFDDNDIKLKFISNQNDMAYSQFSNDFVGNLSIIDVLMFNSPAVINSKLIAPLHV